MKRRQDVNPAGRNTEHHSTVDRHTIGEGLEERVRELDLIQTLGRAAAGARSPDELFTAVLAAFEREQELDLALVAHALEGSRRVVAFRNRPFSKACLQALCRQSARVMGWPDTETFAPTLERFDRFDGGHGPRRRVLADEVMALPIGRRNHIVAALLAVPSRRAGEAPLRLLYAASNQLAVHLDRILSTREAEAGRFRAMLESMPQAVLLADSTGGVTQANPAAATLFAGLGLALDGTPGPGRPGIDLDSWIERARSANEALADGEIRVGDRLLNISISPLNAPVVTSDEWVVVLTDITDSRRLQHQLAQSEKMYSLGQMISGVAHELNNPLTSILGYAQLINRGATDETLSHRVEVLGREAERCQRIVRNLLSFARAREPERQALSLNEIANSVLALMGYQLQADGIEVCTEFDKALHACHGDSHQLQQVLINLLTNARHAIRGSGSGNRIVIRTRRAEDAVVLEVEDNGPGISEELREKIFDPFYTTKPEGQGTGLGLALVYGIVSSHEGTIVVQSCTEGGALFRVQLPLGDPVPRKAGDDRPRGKGSSGTGRILVVDDEEHVARLLLDVLREDGHTVRMATDGKRALRLLEGEVFDLIITDIKMPGFDGEQLFGEIRRRYAASAPTVLLTTGDTVGTEAAEVVSRTGLDLIHKPFDIDELRGAVRARLPLEPPQGER